MIPEIEQLREENCQLLRENRELRREIDSLEKGCAPVFVVNGRYSCLLTPEQLARVLQCSITSLDRWSKVGKIPPPIRLPKETPSGTGRGRGMVRHDLAEVLDFIKKFRL